MSMISVKLGIEPTTLVVDDQAIALLGIMCQLKSLGEFCIGKLSG